MSACVYECVCCVCECNAGGAFARLNVKNCSRLLRLTLLLSYTERKGGTCEAGNYKQKKIKAAAYGKPNISVAYLILSVQFHHETHQSCPFFFGFLHSVICTQFFLECSQFIG